MTIREILADVKSPRQKKVILDTDCFNEIDDQYALAYCYLSDKIDLIAVNAALFKIEDDKSFEWGMEKSYDEIIKVLELTDPNYTTPVFKGSRETMSESGKAYIESPACDNIIKAVKESNEIVYVLAIGAITNVTSALIKDPSIKDNMCVLWLAGNELSFPHTLEFNLEQDLKAGQALLDCGVPVILCPAQNVTIALKTDIEETKTLYGYTPIGDYLAQLAEEKYRACGGYSTWRRTIWDLAAPVALDLPEACEFEIAKAPIFADDMTYKFEPDRHEMIVMTRIDRDLSFKRAHELYKNAELVQ